MRHLALGRRQRHAECWRLRYRGRQRRRRRGQLSRVRRIGRNTGLHISGLEELSVVHRAQVLAALQRANRSVQERNPGKTTKVVAMTDPPASEGHTCYRVLPSGHVGRGLSPSTPR